MTSTMVMVIALFMGGCSKLLGISDPSPGQGDAGPKDGRMDAEIDSSIDSPAPCTVPTTFSAEMSFDVGAVGTGLAVGELNRLSPTAPDVAIAVGDGIQIMSGDGAGGFALGLKIATLATAVVIDDFDITASADDDLVVWVLDSGTIAGVRQDSTVPPPSGFLAPQPLMGTFTNVKSAVSGFIDGGSRPDVVVSDATSSRAFTSSGLDPGTFAAGTAIPGAGAGDEVVLLHDIDGLGRDDAVFVDQGTVKISYNTGGTFGTLTAIGSGAQGRSIGFGNFTGDTTLDLMVGTPSGGRLFKQDPVVPGKFDPVSGTIPEIGGTKMQVLDVNGDTTDDLVVDNRIILQCPGTAAGAIGTFTQVESVYSGGPSVVVDINKNGKPDLLRLEGTTLKVRLQ